MDNCILQWNIDGFYSHLEELKQLLSQFQPIVIALQETKFKRSNNPSLKNYSIFRKDFSHGLSACGGVALLAKSNYSPRSVQLQSELQAIATTLTVANLELTFCSIYLPPDQKVSENQLKNVTRQLPKPFLLCGDFNSHNPLWGSDKMNGSGRIIEKILLDEDLILLNSHEHTHFSIPHRSFSSIDLTICSPNLTPRLKWYVHADLCSSDHFPIITTLNGQSTLPKTSIPSWNMRNDKPNWDLFKQLCDLSDKPTGSPQQKFKQITSSILHRIS